MDFNKISLAALCADICDCMGVEPPKTAEKSGGALKKLCGDKPCDRLVMYNPDAQAEWLVKNTDLFFTGDWKVRVQGVADSVFGERLLP